jgi:hypothetical protein
MVKVAKINTLLQNSNMDDVERQYYIDHIPHMGIPQINKLISILEQEQAEEKRIRKRIKELTSILKIVS